MDTTGTALVTARSALEDLLNEACLRESNSGTHSRLPLDKCIAEITRERDGIRPAPPSVATCFRTVQLWGNFAAHSIELAESDKVIDPEIITACLMCLARSVTWFVDRYGTEPRAAGAVEAASNRRSFDDRRHFHLTATAANAPTFEGAKLLLDQVPTTGYQDPDLASFVQHSRDLVEFCIEAGIPRDSALTTVGILRSINKAQALHFVLRNGPLRFIAEARRIERQMHDYYPTLRRLELKYAVVPSANG